MKRILAASAFLAGAFLCPFLASAQTPPAKVVASCGAAQGIPAGSPGPLTVDPNGNLCGSGGGGGGGGTITAPLGPQTDPTIPVSVIEADSQTQTLSSAVAGPLTGTLWPTGAIPTSGFSSIAIQMTAIGAVATSPQESDDGVTWANGGMCVQSTAVGATAPTNNFNVLNGLFICPLRSNFFRINVGATPTGTPTAVVTLKSSILSPSSVFATQGTPAALSGAWPVTESGSSVATFGIVPVTTGAAAAASLVIKASAGNLYNVQVANVTATAGFLAIINAATAPTTGSAITPLDCVALPANGNASISYAPGPPEQFGVGITALITSAANCFTFTSGTITAFIKGMAR